MMNRLEVIIIVLTKFSPDSLPGIGIDFIEGIEEYIVVNGPITSYE